MFMSNKLMLQNEIRSIVSWKSLSDINAIAADVMCRQLHQHLAQPIGKFRFHTYTPGK